MSKLSTSRYRPGAGTGKYYSRYRATTEAPQTTAAGAAPAEEGSPATRATVRPKGVFSAARRPYPPQLRPRPSARPAAAASDGNRLEDQRDIDDAASHAEPALLAAADVSGTAFTRVPEENAIEASTMLKKVDTSAEVETESPAPLPVSVAATRRRTTSTTEATTTSTTTTTTTPAPPAETQPPQQEETKEDGEKEISKKEEDEKASESEEDRASQRVAALTSAAAFTGGFFKTPAAAAPFDARRITMATEDPILPIEAFFPTWNVAKDDKAR